MWFDREDSDFQGWEHKTPKQRAEICAYKITRDTFDDVTHVRGTLYYNLLRSLGEQALTEDSGQSIEDAGDAFSEFDDFVDELCDAAIPYGEKKRPDFWWHWSGLLWEASKREFAPIRRDDAERMAAWYLKLPYRSPIADRTLVDMLIAAEVFAFAKEIFAQRKAQRFMGGGPMSFFFGRGCTLLLAVAVGGIAYLISRIGIISDDTLVVIVFIIIGLFLLETAWTTLRFPFAWRAQSQHNSRTGQLISDMNGVYSELDSNGPISAQHIRERAQAVSAKGAVWPGPLFVLLEEVIDRGGRL